MTRLLPTVLALAGVALLAPAARADDKVQFNRDIRPILSDNCYACHGPDKSRRKAQLRLDLRDNAVEKGAIVPGKPDESELVARVFADNDDVMPPPDHRKKLTAAQKGLLKRWIAQGAEYEAHWAYLPIRRPDVPPIRNPQSAIRNPVDAFVLARLQAAGLAPSPPADARTLLRRLSLDLTGLPPTPAEVSAFLADPSPAGYGKQVERLLKSPHYGERMAVPWLDAVRFADTVGYHGDQNQNIFPYRDYVIGAFNRNKPFDTFTVEQLAGDLLPDAGDEQLIATGFNRLNMMTREGGAQPKEYLARYNADRVRAVGAAWLGSTVGCAECHDHKFDPITTRDFYALSAFFADVKQWGVYSDYKYTPNPDLKGWSNDHPFPPERVVDSPYLKRQMARLRADITKLLEAAAETEGRQSLGEWRGAAAEALRAAPDGWLTPKPAVPRAGAPGATVTPEGTVLFTGPPRKGAATKVELPVRGWVAAVRLELLPHAEHQGKTVRGNGGSTTVQLSAAVRKNGQATEAAVAFYHADADRKQPRYKDGFEVIGVTNGWATSAEHAGEKQTSVWLLDPPQRLGDGDTLVLTVRSDAAGCVRLSTTPFAALNPLEAGRTDLLAAGAGGAAAGPLAEEFVLGTGRPAEAFARYKRLHRDWLECRGGKAPTMVTEAWEPPVTRVLPRGDWQNETGEVVPPAVPHFLPQPPNPDGRRLTRLDLAKWLVSRDNPLTARAVVNRLWKQFFGAGLSGVLDDLGAQGEPPAHAELLDWLAAEFMDSGWDVKHLVRLIVTSDTYRQRSDVRADLKETDPTNRLLARQEPRRLEAEFVRDNALAVAGLLNPEVGGPSAFPYQPAHYYANLNFPIRDYDPSTDQRQYRRGVYTHWQRTFLHPMLANFDAPSREECWADRVVSNTPQQALTLLNDPTFVEAARAFAARLLTEPQAKDDDGRLGRAFELAVGRPIKAKERESLTAFLAGQRAHYRDKPEDATKLLSVGLKPSAPNLDRAEHAAWANVCRVILNLHETITRY
jgi:hypothetical protein